MKRIINGRTYSTDSSAKVGHLRLTKEDDETDTDEDHTLYVTGGGAYFVHVHDRHDETNDWFDILTKEKAQDWLMSGDVAIYQNPFEEPPEAEGEDVSGKLSVVYLRMPAELKENLEMSAESSEQSLNAWLLRLLEERVREEREKGEGASSQLTTLDGFQSLGFEGFVSVKELRDGGTNGIPDKAGVYIVLTGPSSVPKFLRKSPAGHFKENDPTVPVKALKSKWVYDALALYFGMTRQSLRKRIRTLLLFGQGEPVGHRGGRYLWQIEGADGLLICWKPAPEGKDPRDEEADLIVQFEDLHGSLPFANLQR